VTAAGARLSTEQRGRVLTVTLSNPPRNFFDLQMATELGALVREIDRDASIGAVVLTGRDLFVTHFNVPDLLRVARSAPFPVSYRRARAIGLLSRSLEPLEPLLRRTALGDQLTLLRIIRTVRRMSASDKVFVAAINGLALGMGAILALACDLRVMAEGEDAAFGLIETGISILAGAGGTQRLTRIVGQSRAAELLLEGRPLSPAEAAAIGLVHRVVPAEELHDEALALAHRVAARSPVINGEIKRMVYDAGSRPIGRAMRMEIASMTASLSTARAVEDMEAYQRELARHERPTDRQILDAWETVLDASPDRRRRAPGAWRPTRAGA
jgi:enoyl-CoA hydratase/carnithine racemase